ncbi:hypothetical protein [Dactylosporangium sp. NPDC006015]|uniref:hypothetical protein n=1 Tax=Dactylosporangium sp. NPDC006015 TaxID=3154576 RepID=UPI0033BFA724
MNDVKDICDGMLATAPPPPDARTVLATARRAAGRRRAVGAAGVATLAVAVAAGGTALALRPAPAPVPAQQPPPVLATGPSPAPVVAAPLPAARAAYTHGATMRGLLMAAVPAGYTTADYPVSYDEGVDPTVVLPNERVPAPANWQLSVAFAGVFLRQGGAEGLITASIWATANPVAEDCPPPSCSVVTAGGVSVEVRTWIDEGGVHIAATRRLTGGSLSVIASQGMATAEATPAAVRPALPALPFTTQQVAALALDPAMLQFP